ncbi:unnamed protein product [Protopolystoma xenopodis]|uniref:Uncharacterized protein n=1 Tax=Protopolystoma xenopodis TaxID=117903 RepID=A0A3S5BBK8_9PLAT|nr:unnamed protein product [Protopolystoma xenopodis]
MLNISWQRSLLPPSAPNPLRSAGCWSSRRYLHHCLQPVLWCDLSFLDHLLASQLNVDRRYHLGKPVGSSSAETIDTSKSHAFPSPISHLPHHQPAPTTSHGLSQHSPFSVLSHQFHESVGLSTGPRSPRNISLGSRTQTVPHRHQLKDSEFESRRRSHDQHLGQRHSAHQHHCRNDRHYHRYSRQLNDASGSQKRKISIKPQIASAGVTLAGFQQLDELMIQAEETQTSLTEGTASMLVWVTFGTKSTAKTGVSSNQTADGQGRFVLWHQMNYKTDSLSVWLSKSSTMISVFSSI